ncbi:MAG: hypothetical protein WAN11_04570 [Syntrophobacteraceae bacterium]
MPLAPAELLEWQVFYVELLKQLGLEPEHYRPLLDIQHKWDSKIEDLDKTFSNVKASLRRKEIALRNLDSLLEHDGFDSSVYSQKRNGFLLEIKSLDQKLKDTQKDLEELRHAKRSNLKVAMRLVSSGMELLRPFAPECKGIDVAHLLQSAGRFREGLNEPASDPGLSLRAIPVIRFIE